MKKWQKRLVISLASIVLVLLIIFFCIRYPLLNRITERGINQFNRTHRFNIHYKEAGFKGFSTICFDSLLVTDIPNDTIISIHSLSASLNLRQLLTSHIRFRKLCIDQVLFNFSINDLKDYFISTPETKVVASPPRTDIDLYNQTSRLLRRAFTHIPSRLIVNNVTASFSLDTTRVTTYIESMTLRRGKLKSVVNFTDDQISQTALIEGKIKPYQRKIEVTIHPQQIDSLLHSPMARLFGMDFRYHTISLNFSEKERKGNILRMSGKCSLDRFEIKQESLSSKNIPFAGYSLKYDLSVGTNYIELDSTSTMTIGQLNFNPYLRLRKGHQDSIILLLNVPTFTVEEFYKSLPVELFPHLRLVDAEGSLSYRAKMVVDLHQPDSLVIESKLNADDFRLKHIDEELTKMRGYFSHTEYERGFPVRTFIVGPENPDFLPLDQIPVLLQTAVLTAEDGSFYGHQGFLISGIRRAMAQNIKERKLARGGSTISQQLIKNVYLSREKTISRKFEEFVLVWLIESNHLVSKSRMFEVYLNIIEWGPNVYGAREAAHFYFNKEVDQLNASECIFMASVLPSPKKFYYRFDKQGNLAPFMINYYIDVAGKLNKKGLIASDNGDSIASMLNISGQAKSFLRIDTTLTGSTDYQELIFEETDE